MIFFIDILLILLLIFFYKVYKFSKENPNLHTTNKMFILNLTFILLFIIVFIFFIRFLNLFRYRSAICITDIVNKIFSYHFISIIIFLICFIFFIKFFVFFLKLNFLKVHYYLLNSKNNKYSDFYIRFIYFIVTWPNQLIIFFTFKNINFFQIYRKELYYFFKYFFTFLMLVLFLVDFKFNENSLIFFTKLLPWYSLYQLIHNLNMFFYINIEYLFDTIITDILYPLDIAREYRLYYEYIDHKSVFAPYSTKPEGYLLENDEYLIIRNYIRQRLLN